MAKITTLDDVHNTIKKWLYLKNTNRIDVILATHLTRELKGTHIWIIFIGGSGTAKSELLRALDDGGLTTKVLNEFTPNTLVSGFAGAPDLAPLLDNKTILILDMATLLNLKKDDKAKVWAQLRELYDGNARKITGSGNGKKGEYTGLNITLLASSTGAIDEQILIHQSLGTRELLYRINSRMELDEENKLMEQVESNEKHELIMRAEIFRVVQDFLKKRNYKEIELTQEIKNKIREYVRYLRVMRTTGSHDSYSGDVITTAEPEAPTRVLKQFTRLFKALKSLDDNYSDEKAFEILKEIRDSSCNRDRIEVIEILAKAPDIWHSITEVSDVIRLGKSSVHRHLSILWNLGLIERQTKDTFNGKDVYAWKINKDNSVSKTIIDEVSKK